MRGARGAVSEPRTNKTETNKQKRIWGNIGFIILPLYQTLTRKFRGRRENRRALVQTLSLRRFGAASARTIWILFNFFKAAKQFIGQLRTASLTRLGKSMGRPSFLPVWVIDGPLRDLVRVGAFTDERFFKMKDAIARAVIAVSALLPRPQVVKRFLGGVLPGNRGESDKSFVPTLQLKPQ
ncbi:MAG: hypothetical protein ACRED1_04655 [Limisphaerales bacterium]